MNSNAVTAEGQVWYQLFEAVRYVTNPYALLAFVFLVIIAAMSFTDIPAKLRGAALVALASATLLCIYLLLSSSLGFIERRSLVHLVQIGGANSAELAPGITVEMLDVTSLEGKAKEGKQWSGWNGNRYLPFSVVRRVLEKAVAPDVTEDEFKRMGQAGWDAYLSSLGSELSDRVKDRSFTRLRITASGKVVSDGWWFKGDTIQLGQSDKGIRIKVENIYNTKNLTSGEPEAINLQVV